jgi:hypothetical protein
MTQHDIRLIDKDDPQTSTAIIKEIKKATSDAGDKYETFVVTHEAINLKAKLTLKKRTSALPSSAQTDQNNEEYTDNDDDGLGM